MASSFLSSSAGIESQQQQQQQQQQPPSGDHDRAAANVLEEGLVRLATIYQHFNELQRATVQGDWESGRTILDRLSALGVDPEIHPAVAQIHSLIAAISITGGKQRMDFFAKLVSYLPDESLSVVADGLGRTLLHYAGMKGNKAAAVVLVERVPNLLYVADKQSYLPVHVAAAYSQRETLKYLMSITSLDDVHQQLQMFIFVISEAEFLDIALDLVDKYPQLATVRSSTNETALGYVARFASKYSGTGIRFSNSWELFLCACLQIKGMNGKYLKHQQILKLVKRLCKALESFEGSFQIYTDAALTAANFGGHKVIEVIAETYPFVIMNSDPQTRRTIFDYAIQQRHENVYNLMYRLSGYEDILFGGVDSEFNNKLHVAAKLAPAHRLNQISGAALQMQYEIQWYKEVEKHSTSANRIAENKDQKTPPVLFTIEHQKLKDDGEKWMKSTANSCSIVAALIITMMFTASITVPGGNEGGNESNAGFPIFWGEKAFIIFAIADAVSLFTSATSLLIFLSILTSRFPEESFLYYHPTQLIVGLGNLFLSIATMMVAFIATTFLVLGKKEAWILIPTTAFALLGVASFAFLQFPLLCGLISSTYGPGLFNKKSGKPLL